MGPKHRPHAVAFSIRNQALDDSLYERAFIR
jgi:hypothetical protein